MLGDEEELSLINKSSRFISILSNYKLITENEEMKLQKDLDSSLIIFKIDVLNKISEVDR